MSALMNFTFGLQNPNSFLIYENASDKSFDSFNDELILAQMEKDVKEQMDEKVKKSYFRSERQFWPFVDDKNEQMKRRTKLRPPCSRDNPQFCQRKGNYL